MAIAIINIDCITWMLSRRILYLASYVYNSYTDRRFCQQEGLYSSVVHCTNTISTPSLTCSLFVYTLQKIKSTMITQVWHLGYQPIHVLWYFHVLTVVSLYTRIWWQITIVNELNSQNCLSEFIHFQNIFQVAHCISP